MAGRLSAVPPVRYLEAVPRAPMGIFARRRGHRGRRPDGGPRLRTCLISGRMLQSLLNMPRAALEGALDSMAGRLSAVPPLRYLEALPRAPIGIFARRRGHRGRRPYGGQRFQL